MTLPTFPLVLPSTTVPFTLSPISPVDRRFHTLNFYQIFPLEDPREWQKWAGKCLGWKIYKNVSFMLKFSTLALILSSVEEIQSLYKGDTWGCE